MKNIFIFGVLMFALSSCAIGKPGQRTITYSDDGIKVSSETIDVDKNAVEIAKEDTRQTCYMAKAAENRDVREKLADNPLMLLMLKQVDTINNAMSLIRTGKPYDPCPGSTNEADVEIAESEMYTKIWTKGLDEVGNGLMMWGGVKIANGLFGALASTGYNLTNTGPGTINVNDSFKNVTLGDGAIGTDLFSNKPTSINYAPPVE